MAPFTVRQFAATLETAISQLILLLLEKVNTLQGRLSSGAQAPEQEDKILGLAAGIQAAKYHMQRWDCCSKSGGRVPRPPAACVSAEEAMSTVRVALPRLIELVTSLKASLRQLAAPPEPPPRRAVLSDEELERYLQAEAEAAAEADSRARALLAERGATMQEMHAVVPHLEQQVFNASTLINAMGSGRPVVRTTTRADSFSTSSLI